MNQHLELLARIRGHIEELYRDHEERCAEFAAKAKTIEEMEDMPDDSTFDALRQHLAELAGALGFGSAQVEAALTRQQKDEPWIYM